MNFMLIAFAVVVVAALGALAWALMERGRAGRAEQRAWALNAEAAQDKARIAMLEEQAQAQGEFLRAQATQQASAVADELVKRADEAFKNRELLAQARLEAQLKPVAETLAKVQEQTAAVEKAREYINAGDAFQIVLSQRFRTETRARPFDIYRALRVVNPSPFMFYLRAGAVTLVGASPEIMCRVEASSGTCRLMKSDSRRSCSAGKNSSFSSRSTASGARTAS